MPASLIELIDILCIAYKLGPEQVTTSLGNLFGDFSGRLHSHEQHEITLTRHELLVKSSHEPTLTASEPPTPERES